MKGLPTKRYYQLHKAQIKKRMKEYYYKNKEKFKVYARSHKKRLYDIEYRRKNREGIRTRQRQYYWKNREKILEYRKRNMAKILRYQKEYKKRKRLATTLEKIKTLKGKKQQLQVMIRKNNPHAGLVRNVAQNSNLTSESIFSTGVTR